MPAYLEMQDVIRAEIEVLRNEADAAVRAYFSFKTMREMISADEELHWLLNRNGYFWTSVLSGFQCVFFLSMRKFFDTDTRSHGFNKLIALCENHITVFSKESLARRRKHDFENPADLKAYALKAFVPEKGYFADFKLSVSQELDRAHFRKVFLTIADKVIAHNEVVKEPKDPKVDDVFTNVNTADLEAILLLMQRIATGFRSLWTNGHELDLSVMKLPLQDLVVRDVRSALSKLKREQ